VYKWVNLVGLEFKNVKGQMHVICMYFMYESFGANCQVLCYEHGLGDINSNIGFSFCLEVFGEGEYVICVYTMYGWVKKGKKGKLEFNHF
jgi:hypothetical protein